MALLLDFGPTCRWKHEDRKTAAAKILLIPKILVGRDEKVELPFRGGQQGTILKVRPSTRERRDDFVTRKKMPQRRRRALVEEDSH